MRSTSPLGSTASPTLVPAADSAPSLSVQEVAEATGLAEERVRAVAAEHGWTEHGLGLPELAALLTTLRD